jgi:hypothetical protein
MAVLEVSNGRHVAYEVVGNPDGLPVLLQHGTGDSRLCKYPDDSVAAALGTTRHGRPTGSRRLVPLQTTPITRLGA